MAGFRRDRFSRRSRTLDAGDAVGAGLRGDRGDDRGGDPLVERARDDVVGRQVVARPRRPAPSAAATFMFSVIVVARTSSAPRKTPGKASTLLIWLGKSERPVATTAACSRPPRDAPRGRVGQREDDRVRRPSTRWPPRARSRRTARRTRRRRPAPRSVEPRSPALLVSRASACLTGLRPLAAAVDQRPWSRPPRCRRCPRCSRIRRDRDPGGAGAGDHDAQLAERAAGRAARRCAARPATTIAVPCWSSWKTGMSSSSRSRSSISKQRGALMSSRLMPPKDGREPRRRSRRSRPRRCSRGRSAPRRRRANCLNSRALPSMTGMAAAGPMSPRPSTAVPSETTATTLDTQV